MNESGKRSSHVLTEKEFGELLKKYPITPREELVLVARNPIVGKLRYKWDPVKAYLQSHCRPPTNDCPDNVFELDCTHFVCHSLNKTGVYVKLPSTDCASGLCVRVNELAASFFESTKRYSNVSQLRSHSDTREGDYCFIPSWFGLTKEHAMVLASKATESGAAVYAHTNNRCGEFVDFQGADCAYYRIEEATS